MLRKTDESLRLLRNIPIAEESHSLDNEISYQMRFVVVVVTVVPSRVPVCPEKSLELRFSITFW